MGMLLNLLFEEPMSLTNASSLNITMEELVGKCPGVEVINYMHLVKCRKQRPEGKTVVPPLANSCAGTGTGRKKLNG